MHHVQPHKISPYFPYGREIKKISGGVMRPFSDKLGDADNFPSLNTYLLLRTCTDNKATPKEEKSPMKE